MVRPTMPAASATARPRVVVVGAGFGGLWTARALAGKDVDVVLLERNNYHTFLPLLYQVAAAELVPTDIAYPVRSIFRRAPNVQIRMAEVGGLDLTARVLETSSGPVSYDVLVLAPGSVPHFFGVEGARAHSFPLRWMDDAIAVRHHVLQCFERAAFATDPLRRQSLLTFAVIGGGPTGVEFAGALSELVRGPLLRDFPMIRPDEVSVLVLEASDHVLGTLPSALGAYGLERLRRRGVEVRLGVRAERIHADGVSLAGGERISAETVVWTAGVQGDPRMRAWGLPVGREGRVPVQPTLAVDGHPEVYVVGDLAYLEDAEGRPLPQVAPVAIQEANCAADNIMRALAGLPAREFRFRDPGMLAVIGRNAAVAHVYGRTFRGLPAWILWLAIHIAKLIGFRNRLLVLVNWAWNYVFFRRAVRLILPTLHAGPGAVGEGTAAPAGRERVERT